MRRKRATSVSHRGSVLIAVLCALMMLMVVVIGVVYAGSREQDVTVLRLQASQAQYAAEAGANMALRELFSGVDDDGDGGVGTISNDGNAANDPLVNGARITVVPVAAATGSKFRVTSVVGNTQRSIELLLQTVGGIEGFEAYGVGTALNNVGGWAPWDTTPGAEGYATNVRARTGAMSTEIRSSSDSVHLYTPTSGQWTYIAWQNIPSTATGADTYFILMNTYTPGGSKSWSTQIRFDLGANMAYDNLTGGITGNQVALVRDQWAKIEVVMDLDAGTQTVKYNNTLLFTGSWNRLGGTRTLAAVDLFGSSINDVYYDDIQLSQTGLTQQRLVQWTQIAPP